mgnify:CR=1 FL=1
MPPLSVPLPPTCFFPTRRDVLARALAGYVAALGRVSLPTDAAVLERADDEARRTALEALRSSLLGRARPGVDLGSQLETQMAREYDIVTTKNQAASNEVCSGLENK